jgi:uncharacterized membrane protein
MAGVELSVKSDAWSAVRGMSAARAITAATAVMAVAWSAAADLRESKFLDKRQDLGHFTQAVWATAHGHFMRVTEAGGTDVSRLGIHVDPIVALLAPLWWVWPSPQLLLTVQAIALAAGALPIFWLGRKHLRTERDAALIAGAYLLCPTIGWNAVSDFHAVALAVPLLLFAIWYLDESRFLPFAATAVPAMLCQEQVGLLVGCLGRWYAWRSRRISVGLTIAVLGFGVSLLDFLVVLRHFSGGSPFSARFGGSPTSIVNDLFTHPLRLAQQIDAHDLSGLLLAIPVLGACFGSTILLAAAPQVALLLLSRRSGDWFWFGINVLVILPFVYTATVLALARATTGTRKPILNARRVFVASLTVGVVLGPFSILEFPSGVFPEHASVEAQREAVGLIPTGARVSATNHLALPLEKRQHLYVFPVLRDADWIAVDSRDDVLPDMSYLQRRNGISTGVNDLFRQPRLMRREIRTLRENPNWKLVYRRDTVYVFRWTGRPH